jgi:hypothetical protein
MTLTERLMTRVDDVKRTVAAIDSTRQTEHFRNDDRPDGRAVRARRKGLHPDVIRAQARVRVAAWRNRQDAARIPTTAQIGMAMIVALATARQSQLTEEDRGLVGRALVSLQERGFSVVETKAVLARLRDRIADPADNASSGGPSASMLG